MASDQQGKAELITTNCEMRSAARQKGKPSQARKSLLNKETLE